MRDYKDIQVDEYGPYRFAFGFRLRYDSVEGKWFKQTKDMFPPSTLPPVTQEIVDAFSKCMTNAYETTYPMFGMPSLIKAPTEKQIKDLILDKLTDVL